LEVCQLRNYENRSTSAEAMTKIERTAFFLNTVYMHPHTRPDWQFSVHTRIVLSTGPYIYAVILPVVKYRLIF